MSGGITKEVTKAIKAFLKNKKAVKITIITVVVIVLSIIAACTIYNRHMEKVTLEKIEEHIQNEEYEFAFDKINSGYVSDEDMEKYSKIVIPHMQDEFNDAKKSEKESLSLIVDGTEYFFYDGKSLANSNERCILTYTQRKMMNTLFCIKSPRWIGILLEVHIRRWGIT